MKNKDKKISLKMKVSLAAVLLLAAGTAVAASVQKPQNTSATTSAYKEETVQRGDVVSGISESGTVEFGTTEQTFSVAEITEVSTTDTEDSTSSESGAENTSSAASGMTAAQGMGAQGSASQGGTGGTGSTGTAAGGSAGTSGTMSSGDSFSGESTILEVEEVYVSSGQVVEAGAPVLKLTQDSIEEYREQLKEALKTAKLNVSQEKINLESKRAEAEYNYQMYLAQGETAEETYNATITSLENTVSELTEELEEADDEDEIEELEAELLIAENNLATQSLEAKQTYENALNNYKYADQLYEIDTEGLEDDLNDAKDTKKEAKANLEEFEAQIGDGIIYAENSGTVTEVAYAAGDTMVNDSAVVTYVNSDEVTMTVSVSQEDISQVAIGDAVTIGLTAYEDEEFAGEVDSIATSSTSGSSTVNYDVVIRFTGDITKVYSGMTGEVTFAGKTVGDALYISNKAVHLDGSRSWVKLLDENGEIQETDIVTGFSNGVIVEVTSGLEEGQTVLIESQVTQ